MHPDRDEYAKLLRRRVDERKTERARELWNYRRAAVAAELLTGQQHWDIFLSYIQGGLEDIQAMRDAALHSLADPELVDDNDTRRRRMQVIEMNAMIRAWQSVLALPKDLIEQGDKAKSLIERMELEAA